jgi:phage head maturation protease
LFGGPRPVDEFAHVAGDESTFHGVPERQVEHAQRFRPGSLRRTIRERAGRVPLRLSHGAHPYIGKQPIGKITQLEERRTGGYFEATPVRSRPVDDLVLPMVREGIAYTSFGLMPTPDGAVWTSGRDRMPHCTLTDVDLFELGEGARRAYGAAARTATRHREGPRRKPSAISLLDAGRVR